MIFTGSSSKAMSQFCCMQTFQKDGRKSSVHHRNVIDLSPQFHAEQLPIASITSRKQSGIKHVM